MQKGEFKCEHRCVQWDTVCNVGTLLRLCGLW